MSIGKRDERFTTAAATDVNQRVTGSDEDVFGASVMVAPDSRGVQGPPRIGRHVTPLVELELVPMGSGQGEPGSCSGDEWGDRDLEAPSVENLAVHDPEFEMLVNESDCSDVDSEFRGRSFDRGRRTFFSIKAVYFLLLSGYTSLLPFIPVYLADLGLNAFQIGRIKAVEPLVGLVSPAACGSIADKYSKHKLMIVVSMVGAAFIHGSSLFLPLLKHEPGHGMKPLSTTDMTDVDGILPGDVEGGSDQTILSDTPLEDELMGRCLSCDDQSGLSICSSLRVECARAVPPESLPTSPSGDPSINVPLRNATTSDTVSGCNPGTRGNFHNCSVFVRVQQMCADLEKRLAPRHILAVDLTYENTCCYLQIPCERPQPNNLTVDTHQLNSSRGGHTETIFLTMMAIVFTGSFFDLPPLPLIDASTMVLINDLKKRGQTYQYGRQRIWGGLAVIIWTPLSGFAVDTYSRYYPSSFNGYLPAFVLFVSSLLLCALCAMSIHLPPRPVPESLIRNIFVLLRKMDVLLFLFIAFIYGVLFGILDSYIFLFLQEELNASRTNMGLAKTCTCLAEVVFMTYAAELIRLFGHCGVISAAFFCFGLRFYGYSLLYNPWLVLPIELLHGVAYGAMRPACTSFIHVISSSNMVTTVQTLADGTGTGFGKLLGALLGGMIYQRYGPRALFRGAAVLGLLTSVFYYTTTSLLRKRRSTKQGWQSEL